MRTTLTIPCAFAPGDRVRLDPLHVEQTGNTHHPGDFGHHARGTVVEVRWRGDYPILVVEWDGGSCRNHHPKSLEAL